MNILYIGKFSPQNMLRTVNEDNKGLMGMSDRNFEMPLLNGLRQQENINLKYITCPDIFSYPQHNKEMFIESESYAYKNTYIRSVDFYSLMGVKGDSAKRITASNILKAIEGFEGDAIHIIINTPDIRLLGAIKAAKRKAAERMTQTVVIPDIPSIVFGMDRQNPVKAYLLARRNKKITETINNSNDLVLFTETMMDFHQEDLKHIVMESIIDVGTMDEGDVEPTTDKRVVLYTGALRKIFGIMSLAEAFRMVKNGGIKLWVRGSGDSKGAINEAARVNSRIKFFGLVDSETALETQHKAAILVNPRTSKREYTRYPFPSKTMKYLLAGRSVIINRLSRAPEEYYDYVYIPKNESVEALTECISSVIHLDIGEREERTKKGRQFTIEKKNSKVQMKRIIKMIESYANI